MTNTLATPVSCADVPVNTTRGGELRVLLSPTTVGATSGFLGVLTLQPGEWMGEHYHPYSEEFLFVTEGTVTVRMDGVPVTVENGAGLLIPKNVRHRVQNDGTTTVNAVFHLCPLAPRPELGHVNTEPLPHS